jgi:hypothetical protein
MVRISLSPLGTIVARKLSERRGITVERLVDNLLEREAAVELAFGPHAPEIVQPEPAAQEPAHVAA